MTDLTATQVRRDAITRLITLAGGTYDPADISGISVDILHRQALRHGVACGDPTVPYVTAILLQVIRDQPKGSLLDAVQAGGIDDLLDQCEGAA